MNNSLDTENQIRLDGILASVKDAVIAMDEGQHIVLFNPAAELMFGRLAGEAMGTQVAQFFSVASRDGHDGLIGCFREAGMADPLAAPLITIGGLRANGDEFPIEASISFAPIGADRLATVILRDLTERSSAFDEQLGGARRRLEGIVESAMDAIITVDERHRIILFNPAAEQMFGLTREEAVDQPLTMLMPERLRGTHEAHIRHFIETGVTNRKMGALGAVSGLRANGEEFPIEASISHIEVGGEHLATVILRDISERRATEDARNLLAREVDHRAKNALAVARSLICLTRADTKEGFATAVEGRISALARAHSLLADSRWQGAELAATIESELAPYIQPGQSRLKGPSVVLRAAAVQPISLVLHELATNACKYGALKREHGVIELDWSVREDGMLEVNWRERGGPAVRTPDTRGFGSVLLSQVIHRQLDGELAVDWAPAGVQVTMLLPAAKFFLDRRTGRSDDLEPWTWSLGAGELDAGPIESRILIVEDEALIALELNSGLSRLGWTVMGPASSLDEGLKMADQAQDLIAAVLDVNLDGRSVFPLAQALQDRSIPFVFCTGYDVVDLDGRFKDAPVMHKPVDISLLDRKLTGLIALARSPAPAAVPLH